jgi:hypothetical protein
VLKLEIFKISGCFSRILKTLCAQNHPAIASHSIVFIIYVSVSLLWSTFMLYFTVVKNSRISHFCSSSENFLKECALLLDDALES